MRSNLAHWLPQPTTGHDPAELAELNRAFARLSAADRVRSALEILPAAHVLASSFGAQAAVMLHLVTRIVPSIPVVLIDTGYLFPETYRFVDRLTADLKLNLHVFRADASPAWQETRFGRLWEQGADGIDRYNQLNKQEPMRRALEQLDGQTWLSGLRRSQGETRALTAPVEFKRDRYKVHPIFDWTDRDVGRYLTANKLPYHPLWDKGYLSIGDWHTTRSLAEAGSAEGMRFFGLRRECGIHGD
jgi:phosphoadenosine phosphosulfate reductase